MKRPLFGGMPVLLAAALVLSVGCSHNMPAAPEPNDCAHRAISDERLDILRAKLADQQRLPLVITLAVPDAETIHAVQERVLTALAPHDFDLRYRPRSVPQLFVAVDARGLEILACLPDVADIRAESTMKRR
ncbi:MAG: hypothetical protein ACP5DC_01680 [Halothiobacillaceae bacterium]